MEQATIDFIIWLKKKLSYVWTHQESFLFSLSTSCIPYLKFPMIQDNLARRSFTGLKGQCVLDDSIPVQDSSPTDLEKRTLSCGWKEPSELLRSRAGISTILGQEGTVNAGQDSSIRDCHVAQELAELLIVPHCEFYVPGRDPAPPVISCSVSGELQQLISEVNGPLLT